MMINPTKITWSDETKKLTIDLFDDKSFQAGPDGVAMKYQDGRFGFISLDDALSQRIVIHVHPDGGEERFEKIENAIEAGWVID